MPDLIITQGLPGSGKTTWAIRQVTRGQGRVARVNRDDLRRMMFDGQGILPRDQEDSVTTVQHAAVRVLLTHGITVIADDTNLRRWSVEAWRELADQFGANLVVRSFMHVPVDVCVAQDQARGAVGGREVGEAVIRGMHARFNTEHLPVIT